MKRRNLLMLAIALPLIFATTSFAMGKRPSKVVLEEPAPEIYFPLGEEEETTLNEINFRNPGKMIVICFLSYDCPLSRMVVRSASMFYEDHEEILMMLGVSPMSYENAEILAMYKEEARIAFDLFYDESGELTYQFGPKQAPTFYVFNANQFLQYVGGLEGMKRAVMALKKGETDFTTEGVTPGCFVPKRRVKFKKRQAETEIIDDIDELMVQEVPEDGTRLKSAISFDTEI